MEAWGYQFAASLRPGDIVKITGPLGAGKTTLVRGLVAGLGGNPDEVHSPTFSLVHVYQTPTVSINHCDFYRLADNSDLEDFGGLEFFDTSAIYFVEWPERIRLWKSITSNRLLHLDLRIDESSHVRHLSAKIKIVD